MNVWGSVHWEYNYSQTSVFEHDSFWKAVQKPICLKTYHIFPLQIMLKRLIRFMYQKNNLFACLHYTLYIIV